MSMDTSTEEDEDSFDSKTEAIIFGTSDHSGESMISGPNIAPSSSSDDDHHHHQQQISTAAAAADGTDELIVSSSASSSSWFTNNNKQIDQQEPIMIFNVDFRALSSRDAVNNNCNNLQGSHFFGPDLSIFSLIQFNTVPLSSPFSPVPSFGYSDQDLVPSFGYSDQDFNSSCMAIDTSVADHESLELDRFWDLDSFS